MTTMADDRLLNLEPAAAQTLSQRLGEPAWALEVRRAGLLAWEQLPFPKKTDEAWRRTDPQRFCPEGRKIVLARPAFDAVGEEAAQGLTCLPIERALEGRPQAQDRLFSAGQHRQDKFSALNAAYRSGGAWVEVPQGLVAQAPLRITHQVDLPGQPAAFFPHTVLVGGRHSQATVIESFGSDSGDLVSSPVVEIHLEEGARMQYVVVSRWGEGASALTRLVAHLAKDSQLRVLFLGLGGATTKAFVSGELEGTGSKSEFLGLVFASSQQHFDVDTQQNHKVPACASDVLFNCALDHRARTVFTGNIFVAPGAQQTDAYQKNRNLLLSGKAHADSSPKLELLANDVRCTHGATFATYDQDQQFYLQSRGMRDAEARRLIISGFFQEVIERLEGPALVEWLSGLMQDKMEASLGHQEA